MRYTLLLIALSVCVPQNALACLWYGGVSVHGCQAAYEQEMKRCQDVGAFSLLCDLVKGPPAKELPCKYLEGLSGHCGARARAKLERCLRTAACHDAYTSAVRAAQSTRAAACPGERQYDNRPSWTAGDEAMEACKKSANEAYSQTVWNACVALKDCLSSDSIFPQYPYNIDDWRR